MTVVVRFMSRRYHLHQSGCLHSYKQRTLQRYILYYAITLAWTIRLCLQQPNVLHSFLFTGSDPPSSQSISKYIFYLQVLIYQCSSFVIFNLSKTWWSFCHLPATSRPPIIVPSLMDLSPMHLRQRVHCGYAYVFICVLFDAFPNLMYSCAITLQHPTRLFNLSPITIRIVACSVDCETANGEYQTN